VITPLLGERATAAFGNSGTALTERGPVCALLTTEANETVRRHNRMPVILPPASSPAGSTRPCKTRGPDAAPAALPAGEMVAYPVSTVVNSLKNGRAGVVSSRLA